MAEALRLASLTQTPDELMTTAATNMVTTACVVVLTVLIGLIQ